MRRIRQPHEGRWALPGGPLLPDEDLAASARHTLERTTGLTSSYLEQLYSFGAMERSPERVVSIVYWALVRSDEVARAVDGENVQWFVADEIPELAFDHNGIVQYALNRLRAKITYSPIARFFLRPEFTLAELPRGARGGAAQADRPRELPAPGAGHQDPRPDRQPAHRHQPPTTRSVPLPGHAYRQEPTMTITLLRQRRDHGRPERQL